jgi:DNA-directed RNA polymerase subunit RPC12/RpoP
MFDPDKPAPAMADGEAPRPTQWRCSRCCDSFLGAPESSLDARWAFARCRTCGKRVVMVGGTVGAPHGKLNG